MIYVYKQMLLLPTEHPFRDVVRIYLKRLAIVGFSAVLVALIWTLITFVDNVNIDLFSAIALISLTASLVITIVISRKQKDQLQKLTRELREENAIAYEEMSKQLGLLQLELSQEKIKNLEFSALIAAHKENSAMQNIEITDEDGLLSEIWEQIEISLEYIEHVNNLLRQLTSSQIVSNKQANQMAKLAKRLAELEATSKLKNLAQLHAALTNIYLPFINIPNLTLEEGGQTLASLYSEEELSKLMVDSAPSRELSSFYRKAKDESGEAGPTNMSTMISLDMFYPGFSARLTVRLEKISNWELDDESDSNLDDLDDT